MYKSQLTALIREVLQETIRKVDGKYVVYPEKGGKRLGTHSTRKAAEKQLTAIHLNKEVVSPPDGVYQESWLFAQMQKGNKDIMFLVTKHPGIDTSEEIEIFEKAKQLGYRFLKVNHSRGEAYIIYVNTPQAETKAKELLKIANKHGGYLDDKTPDEAREIGRLLDYLDTDTEDYIARRYNQIGKTTHGVNEVGEGNAEPYIISIKDEKHKVQEFYFQTDPYIVKDENGEEKEVSGTEYRVYIYKVGYRSKDGRVSYEVTFTARSYDELDYNYNTTNQGTMFRVMATIVKIIKYYLKKHPEITEISFSPEPKKGENKIDNKRAKLYMAYIKRHFPGTTVDLNHSNNTVYINIPKKEEVEENSANDTDIFKFQITDKVHDEGDNSLITVEYKFNTSKDTYRVEFYSGEYDSEAKIFDLAFGLDREGSYKLDTFQMTGKGQVKKILQTLTAIIQDFLTKFNVEKVNIFPTDEKRRRVYKAVIGGISKVEIHENYVLKDLEDKFDIDLDLYHNGESLILSRIVIPKDKRGEGIGTKVMKLITQYADAQNKPIYLTPSKDFGATSTGRLEQFYKQFGFKKKDRSDFSTKETMIREPQTSENYADGKVKGKSRPGRVKKSGASCKGSVTDLRAKAKKYGGEKGKMYHWCANMKGGKK